MKTASLPHTVIAIDGPSASGKSTVAREVAKHLNYAYVDTGAMYRAATLAVIKAGIDHKNSSATASCVINCGLRAIIENSNTSLFFGGEKIHHTSLKSPEVNALVSDIAGNPEVRKFLVAIQRELAQHAPLVMEGRDIGTVVFPHTPHKFYLDADPAVREARRRQEGAQDAIHHRDAKDSSRQVAPLRVAEDADIIDSTHMTIEQVVQYILRKLASRKIIQPPQ
jgi:cytidylate kinase